MCLLSQGQSQSGGGGRRERGSEGDSPDSLSRHWGSDRKFLFAFRSWALLATMSSPPASLLGLITCSGTCEGLGLGDEQAGE
eukprot:121107-Hanusia_phi.AAC.1